MENNIENMDSQLTKEIIKQLIEIVKNNPNDSDLGKEIRKIYNLFLNP